MASIFQSLMQPLSRQFPPVQSRHAVFVALCLLATPYAQAQRAQTFAADAFGYQIATAADCPMQWVDISAAGSAVSLQAAGADPASDDGGAVLDLNEAFEFYGRTYQQLVISSNGYLGVATDLASENGGDFSNDCPLPAVPDNGPAQRGRIAVLHDDLQAGSGGEVYQAYLAPCPRAGAFPDEACTVVQWQNWDYHQQSGAGIVFQVLLYHQSRAVVAQYQDAAGITTDSATLGLQSPGVDSALVLNCNIAAALPASGAWCAEYPLAAEQLLVNGFE